VNEVEALLKAYVNFLQLPWDQTLAGPQKVWFAIYEPPQERRLRLHLPEFEIATKHAGHPWFHLDLTDRFAEWMAQHEYREAYFEVPEDMELELQTFSHYVAQKIIEALTQPGVDANTVVAISGLASLFGLTYASATIETVAPSIRGRLLVFFPGQRNGSNYRFLDARDGWNYLAVPITGIEGE
jgi:hypothetical protein